MERQVGRATHERQAAEKPADVWPSWRRVGVKPRGPLAEGTEPLAAKREPESPATIEQLMEEVCERENLKKALKRVKANKGSPGVDGMTVERTAGLPERALADHPGTAAERDLQAAAGEAGGDSQAGRRGAQAWHPDGAGPIHPAGGAAGSASAAGTRRSPSTATASGPGGRRIRRWPGAAVHGRGLPLGGGH